MPIYEYRCDNCDIEFERIQKAGDEPPDCPECGGQVEKQMSVTGGIVMDGGMPDSVPCCGQEGPCDSPKRCCGK